MRNYRALKTLLYNKSFHPYLVDPFIIFIRRIKKEMHYKQENMLFYELEIVHIAFNIKRIINLPCIEGEKTEKKLIQNIFFFRVEDSYISICQFSKSGYKLFLYDWGINLIHEIKNNEYFIN